MGPYFLEKTMSRIITDLSGPIARTRTITDEGIIQTKSSQDVTDIIQANKDKQNDLDFRNGYTESGDMKHVASVPLIIWEKWWKDECKRRGKAIPIYGKIMEEVSKRHLNDPDNKFLRTGLGEIGTRKGR